MASTTSNCPRPTGVEAILMVCKSRPCGCDGGGATIGLYWFKNSLRRSGRG